MSSFLSLCCRTMTKRGEAISQILAPSPTPSTHTATMTLELSCSWLADLSARDYMEITPGSGASFARLSSRPCLTSLYIPPTHHCSCLSVFILSVSVFTGLRSVKHASHFFKWCVLVKFVCPLFSRSRAVFSWLLISFTWVTKQSFEPQQDLYLVGHSPQSETRLRTLTKCDHV